jgi:hypothetical protein
MIPTVVNCGQRRPLRAVGSHAPASGHGDRCCVLSGQTVNEGTGMKHFLNGVGVAAVIAIAAPALAQASATSGLPSNAATSVQIAQAAAQSPAAARPQRPAQKSQPAKARGGSAIFGPTSGNNVANELNRMELQRLQTGAPPPPPMAAPRPGAGPQPGLSTSSSSYIPPSPPGPVSTSNPYTGGLSTSSGTYIPPSPPGPVSTSGAASMGPKDSGGGYIPAPTGPMAMPPPPPISAPVR